MSAFGVKRTWHCIAKCPLGRSTRLGGLRLLLQFFVAIPVFALQCFDMA
jgi:hypothetical protein